MVDADITIDPDRTSFHSSVIEQVAIFLADEDLETTAMADRLWHSLPEERLISVSFAFRKASEALARCQAKSSTSVRQYFHACS